MEQTSVEVSGNSVQVRGFNKILGKTNELSNPNSCGLTPQCLYTHRNKSHVPDHTNSDPDDYLGLNAPSVNRRDITNELIPIYDIKAGIEEKFVNSIMHFNQFDEQTAFDGSECQIFKKWQEQSDFNLALYHWVNS